MFSGVASSTDSEEQQEAEPLEGVGVTGSENSRTLAFFLSCHWSDHCRGIYFFFYLHNGTMQEEKECRYYGMQGTSHLLLPRRRHQGIAKAI